MTETVDVRQNAAPTDAGRPPLAASEQPSAEHAAEGEHHHDRYPFLAHHYDTPEHQFEAGKLGIWIFLVTEILFFAGLFTAYSVYRSTHEEIFVWAHYYLDTNLGAVNTAVLILSSLTAAWAVRAAQLGQRRLLVGNIVVTIACAFVFMGIKYAEYSHKFHDGLLWGGRPQADGSPAHYRFDPKEPVWELARFEHDHPAAAAAARRLAGKLGHEGAAAGGVMVPNPDANASPAAASAAQGVAPGITALPAASAAAAPNSSVAALGVTAPPAAGAAAAPSSGSVAGPGSASPAASAAAAPSGGVAAPGAAPSPAAGSSASPAGSAALAPGGSAVAAADPGPGASSSAAVPAASGAAAQSGSAAPATVSGGNAPAPDPSGATVEAGVISAVTSLTPEEALPLLRAGILGQKAITADQPSRPKNAHIFFGIYFFMTGLHGIHVLAGIAVWIWLLVRAISGQFGPNYFGPIDYAALYWHIVDLIWIYLFPLLYLIH